METSSDPLKYTEVKGRIFAKELNRDKPTLVCKSSHVYLYVDSFQVSLIAYVTVTLLACDI